MKPQSNNQRWVLGGLLVLALALLLFGTLLPTGAQAGPALGQQPQATVQATAMPTTGGGASIGIRRRVEAPPMPTATGAVLVVSNLLLAAGVVGFAYVLRRRQRR